ncbi:tyrosine-type recombinase/integrase [Rhodococcus artemisiae]|uniref:Site-specific integrase n=1 Tax=Rhodococcus artemisiae TaxID=714159 RepID=A0ABU7LBN6_9NOCA|nr:site-specific integrase [Rhodococcus artemisiae]MEE2058930.1 site-specific integrase [Rhodococcus artemisiae]
MARRQLPPQIKKIELDRKENGKQVVRYQLTVDVGNDPVTGKRKQFRKRYAKLADAEDKLSSLQADVAKGAHAHASSLTVEQACAQWLAGRRIRPSTLAAYTHSLQPLRDVHGSLLVRKLTKLHLDELVAGLMAGTIPKPDDTPRRKWKATSINPMLATLGRMMDDLVKQGSLVRNVAELVDRVPKEHVEMQTFTEAEVRRLLAAAAADRNEHAWHLALSGLRRGEICGLRWSDVDLKKGTLQVSNNRVSVNGKPSEGAPKSDRSGRTLPLTPALKDALKRARKRQAEEKLALGEAYDAGIHVVCDPAGQPFHPDTISDYWRSMCKTAKVSEIRLHDARHTCGTLMHLQGVPIVVIAAWLGHADAAFTMRTYMHSQDDALKDAAASWDRVVTTRDNSGSG